MSDPEITLSAETLAALKSFATSSGITCDEDDDILQSLTKHFDTPDKEDIFDLKWEKEGICVELSLKGVKRELGQTLSSTGLTIWTAAEYMCDWIFYNSQLFQDQEVCELGCGLGMVSILLGKLHVTKSLLATDGDDDTMTLLNENIQSSNATQLVNAHKLYWGETQAIEFKSLYCPKGLDILLAADVIYEMEQIEPLIITVTHLLRRSGTFYLSFYPRNVPVDHVFLCADKYGLSYEHIPYKWSMKRKGSILEKLYKFTWK